MKQITSISTDGSESQAAQISELIKKEGAVILRNLITKENAELIKENLLRCLEEDNSKYGADYIFSGMVHALMNRGDVFIDLIGDKKILSIFKAILGHGCIVHAYNSSSMPPSLSNFSRSIHVDCPRLVPGYITNMGLTIAIDNFTSENGAMEIIPDSFGLINPPDEEQFAKQKIDLDNLKVGDAILFNARCWHRGGINKTDKWRHAVSMNICRAYMRQQFDFPVLLGDKKMETLSDDIKQFLGYFVRMPYNMDEFLLPKEKRKYKHGQE